MSSYQHRYMTGNLYRDTLPDYLTCGYCAKEFLLDNITLFIAHKSGGCEKNAQIRSSSFAHLEDTSSPLTCSSCSRVFMTARGLLHHVQDDHQMKICLQKGPLIISDPGVRPPPAHSSLSGMEFSTSDPQSCCTPGTKSSPICDQNDQPTDLSMSCANSLGKAVISCSERECKITIKPNSSLLGAQSDRPGSALPKKRFLFRKSTMEEATGDAAGLATADDTIMGHHGDDDEDKDSIDELSGRGSVLETRGDSEKSDDPGMSISVTAEYQKEALCCVSLSTEKKHGEKNAKLKRLLQKNLSSSAAELEGQAASTCEAETTKVVYKVPFVVPSNPESTKLTVSTAEAKSRSSSSESDFSLKRSSLDAQGRSPRFTEGTTFEQNIDQLIRASISSNGFSEDFEILGLDSSSLSPNTRKDRQELTIPLTPASKSPRLMLPGEKIRRFSQSPMDAELSPFSTIDKSDSLFDTAQRMQNLAGEITASYQTSPGRAFLPSPSPVSPLMTTRQTSAVERQMQYLNSSLTLNIPGSTSPLDGSSMDQHLYRDVLNLKAGTNGHPPDRNYDVSQHPLNDDFLKTFSFQQRLSTTSTTRTEPTASTPMLTLRRDDQHRQSMPDEDSLDLSSGSRDTPVPRNMDSTVQNGQTTGSTTPEDAKFIDAKVLKKRRYPTSRPFKCSHCDQAFNQRIHLKKHMSKHTGVKPFKCQQCDYSTVERSHLKVHYRIHTGEKPYRCMYCDYATAQNSTLKIHLKRHHEGHPTTDNTRGSDTQAPAGSSPDDEDSVSPDTFFLGFSSNSHSVGKTSRRLSSAIGGRTVSAASAEKDSAVRSDRGNMIDTTCNMASRIPLAVSRVSEPLISVPSVRQLLSAGSVHGKTLSARQGDTGMPLKLRTLRYEQNIESDAHGMHVSGRPLDGMGGKGMGSHEVGEAKFGHTAGQQRDNLKNSTSRNPPLSKGNSPPDTSQIFQAASLTSQASSRNTAGSASERKSGLVLWTDGVDGLPPASCASSKDALLRCAERDIDMTPQKSQAGNQTTDEFASLNTPKGQQPHDDHNGKNAMDVTEEVMATGETRKKSVQVQEKEPTRLMVKSSSLMSVEEGGDDDDDDFDGSDLNYSPALPSVSIPDKAFVRG